jgi:hypothetical protein
VKDCLNWDLSVMFFVVFCRVVLKEGIICYFIVVFVEGNGG